MPMTSVYYIAGLLAFTVGFLAWQRFRNGGASPSMGFSSRSSVAAGRSVTTRRVLEMSDPMLAFSWAILSAYKGDADFTALAKDEAERGLKNGWGLSDRRELDALVNQYRSGELNPAFDAARILALLQLAVSAGWYRSDEIRPFVQECNARILQSYPGWDSVIQEVWVGQRRWWAEVARKPMPESAATQRPGIEEQARSICKTVPFRA